MAEIVVTDERGTNIVTSPAATSVVSAAGATRVIIDDTKSKPSFNEASPDIFVVTKTGPRGPTGSPGAQGETGPAGPAGPRGETAYVEAETFRWVQMQPSTTWDVIHTLSKRYPEINVILSDGSLVEGEPVYLDAFHLTISFSAAVSGEAYLT